ncbi:MBL fold metallo-hydrolase [Salinisphaera sp. T31B1]|uniref:MBL fold metallo-hydrolase n=1 Tax=Salinisphaera sp. T31B1 TaxID=727963 RepID=UPI00333E6C0A
MIKLGDTRLDVVWETDDHSFDAQQFFKHSTREDFARHEDWISPLHFDAHTNRIALSMHSWLVRTPRLTVLIDGCVGNDKQRPTRPAWHELNTPFLDRLAALGVKPADVDYVMCTHLHADHVGWNTCLVDGRWVPTFPNAKYVISRREHEIWQARFETNTADEPGHHLQSFIDSVLPIVEAGKALIVDDGYELDDLITIEAAPGHTEGHVAIWLHAGRESGVFTGDVIHHPIQIHHPDWSCMGCENPTDANRTRARILERCLSQGTLLLPGHFMAPHAGYVEHDTHGLSFRFVDGRTTRRDD